jgi:hypothetical protein
VSRASGAVRPQPARERIHTGTQQPLIIRKSRFRNLADGEFHRRPCENAVTCSLAHGQIWTVNDDQAASASRNHFAPKLVIMRRIL